MSPGVAAEGGEEVRYEYADNEMFILNISVLGCTLKTKQLVSTGVEARKIGERLPLCLSATTE